MSESEQTRGGARRARPEGPGFAVTIGAAVVLALALGMAEADVRATLRAAGWNGA